MNRLCLFFIITIATVLLVSKEIVFSQVFQDESDFSNLTLEINTQRKEFTQFEPIFIDLKLSNNTTKPILGHTVLDFRYSPIQVTLSHKGVKNKVSKLSFERGLSEIIIKPKEIAVGETHQSTQAISIELEKLFFEAGQYQIQVSVYDTKGSLHIESNILSITINKAKGVNLLAYNYIKDRNLDLSQLFNIISVPQDEDTIETLRNLVINYKDSVYADYANCWLAIHYFFENDYQTAIQLLEPLEKKHNLVCSDKVLYYLATSNLKSNNFTKAKIYSKLLRQTYPASQYSIADDILNLDNKE